MAPASSDSSRKSITCPKKKSENSSHNPPGKSPVSQVREMVRTRVHF